MQPIHFALAILLLLATPGPTNTLLWLSGAAVGPRRSFPLLIAELGGYLTVVVPAATLAAPLLSARPEVAFLMKLVAAAWILFMAHSLWTMKAQEAERPITPGQVFVTTVLNPKALIIALVIMPQVGLMAMLPWLAGFAVMTMTAGMAWVLAGALLGRLPGQGGAPRLPHRIAAGCLVLFSLGMAGSAIASVI